MVTGKVKTALGLQKSGGNGKAKPDMSPIPEPSLSSSAKKQQHTVTGAALTRLSSVYFPWASAQVQPRLQNVAELLRIIKESAKRETRLRMELLEQKLPKESAAIVPILETENERLWSDNEVLHTELSKQNHKYGKKIWVFTMAH